MLHNWISWNSLCEGEGFGAITLLFYQNFGNLEKIDGFKFYSKIDDGLWSLQKSGLNAKLWKNQDQ